MSANAYGTVNLLHLDAVKTALADRDQRIAELDAENERLKCCGNCLHFDIHHDPYGECEEECDVYFPGKEYGEWTVGEYSTTRPWEPCHYAESRWEARP